MDIKKLLVERHSKATTMRITNYIGNDPERFSELMEHFFSDDKKLAQRAAWILSTAGCKQPDLLRPYLSQLVDTLEQQEHHPAIHRNILKAIADSGLSLPEDEQGQLVHLAFEFMTNPKTPVAIQVHAMQCVANLLPVYPDLAIELKEVIEEGMEYGTAGYRSRGKRILKKIRELDLSE